MAGRDDHSSPRTAERNCGGEGGSHLSGWRKFLRQLRFPVSAPRYEPSKHYMRGPGPKSREALARSPADAAGLRKPTKA
jgi:hypothetical protein